MTATTVSSLRRVPCVALLLLVASACGGGDDPVRRSGLGGRCATGGDCNNPYVCVSGTCQLASGEGSPCPNGNECEAPLVCEAARCTANVGATCDAQADCASSLVCYLSTCVEDEPASASCSEPGAPPSLTVGAPITDPDPGLGACSLPVRSAVGAAGQVQHVGARPVGNEVSFSVPPSTTGISIVSQEVPGTAVDTIRFEGQTRDYPNSVVPDLLRDPSGAVLWDDVNFPEIPEAALVYYGGVTQGAGALTIPNTPRLLERLYVEGALPEGTWRFRVNDWAYECATSIPDVCGSSGSTTGQYDVTVITRDRPLASTGAMDLALYLVSEDLTASQAQASPRVRRFVDSISTILGRAGLCLGEVTLHDLPAWARERYATVDVNQGGPCGPLSQLFTLSRGGNAIHLFLVDDLTAGSTDGELGIAGIDGSIPGPSAVPGTINSGAAVGMGTTLSAGACSGGLDLARCGPDFLAYVAAHEIGHWMGLYHTTEQTGEFFDPLTDTPTCDCSSCARTSTERATCSAGGGTMWATSCDGAGDAAACRGADNLMFWLVDQDVSIGNLSRQQGQVMRLNPVVR